jgi:hypothetical protein
MSTWVRGAAAGPTHPALDEPPRRRIRIRVRLVVACVVTVLVLLVVAAELLLPSLAERRLRGSLGANGSGIRVSIRAQPALKLLTGRADVVDIHIHQLTAGQGGSGSLLARTGRVAHLDATVDQLHIHGLVLQDVALHEDHGRLTAHASVTRRAIRAALPSAVRLDPGKAAGGIGFTATVHAFGRSAATKLVVRVRDGRLSLAPDSIIGGLVQVAIFSDPRVIVEAIAVHGTDPVTFSARGHVSPLASIE